MAPSRLTSGFARVLALAVAATGLMVLAPAVASAVDGGYTSYEVYRTTHGSSPSTHVVYGPDDIAIDVTGSSHRVEVAFTAGSGGAWRLAFGTSENAGLQPGQTYATANKLSNDCGTWGSPTNFTVHELSYIDDIPAKLSLTYSNYCSTYGRWLSGTIAWHADQPAHGLPGVAGAVPDPAQDLQITPGYDHVDLSWTNPTVPDWADSVVVMKRGMVAPASVSDGTVIYTGSGTKASVEGIAERTVLSFSVFARDSEGLVSTPISHTVGGASLTLTSSKPKVRYGVETKLFGAARDRQGHALASYPVEVLCRRAGTSTWYKVGLTWTDQRGYYSLRFAPAETLEYWAFLDGVSGDGLGASAGGFRVPVVADAQILAEHTSIRLGSTTRYAAGVAPAKKGAPILLQEKVGKSWKTVATGKVNPNRPTIFSIKPTSRGKHVYRVYWRGSKFIAAGSSRELALTVS